MRVTRVTLFLTAFCLLIGVTSYAGGWAIVTLNEFPDYAIAGKTFSGTFSVRQHGSTLLDGLKPVIRATGAGHSEIKALATPSGREGEYRFELTLPKPGEWNIAIDSRFLQYLTGSDAMKESPKVPNAGYVVLPLKVIAQGSAPITISEQQRGEWLFNAKGCTGCHTTEIGPDLANLKLQPEYVKRLLADPAATLKISKSQYGQMPNLNLKAREINALTEFLLAGKGKASTSFSSF